MFDRIDRNRLALWCQSRAMQFRPDAAGIVLEPAFVLVSEGREFRLEDRVGNLLATASDVQALLDALDAGVGEFAAEDGASQPDALAASAYVAPQIALTRQAVARAPAVLRLIGVVP